MFIIDCCDCELQKSNKSAVPLLYLQKQKKRSTTFSLVWFMVFNVTFKNILVTLWQSVLLVEETRVPRKTINLPQVTHKLYYTILYRNVSVVCKQCKML